MPLSEKLIDDPSLRLAIGPTDAAGPEELCQGCSIVQVIRSSDVRVIVVVFAGVQLELPFENHDATWTISFLAAF